MKIDSLRGKFIHNRPVGASGEFISGKEINSMGYRAPEFDTVSWKDSIVIFGCSNVFGIGLSKDDTIGAQLERLVGIPVINLGVPSGSIKICMLNQLALHEIEERPRAVVNCWTSSYRTVLWDDNSNWPNHIGHWILDERTSGHGMLETNNTLWSKIMSDRNRQIEAIYNKRLADVLWKKTKHAEITFFPDIQKLFGIPCVTLDDHGTDNAHPGPKTALKVAKEIAHQLQFPMLV